MESVINWDYSDHRTGINFNAIKKDFHSITHSIYEFAHKITSFRGTVKNHISEIIEASGKKTWTVVNKLRASISFLGEEKYIPTPWELMAEWVNHSSIKTSDIFVESNEGKIEKIIDDGLHVYTNSHWDEINVETINWKITHIAEDISYQQKAAIQRLLNDHKYTRFESNIADQPILENINTSQRQVNELMDWVMKAVEMEKNIAGLMATIIEVHWDEILQKWLWVDNKPTDEQGCVALYILWQFARYFPHPYTKDQLGSMNRNDLYEYYKDILKNQTINMTGIQKRGKWLLQILELSKEIIGIKQDPTFNS